MGHMAPAQKVKKGRPLVGFPNTAPVVTITLAVSPQIVDVPSASGEFTATAIDAEQGDIASSLVWTTLTVPSGEGYQDVNVGGGEGAGSPTGLADDGTSGFADAAVSGTPAGGATAGMTTASYDLDVVFDAGGPQPLVVPVTVTDTWDVVAATIHGLLINGSCAFVAGAFRVTSVTLGVTSTAFITEGTGGPSGGGGFIAEVDAAASGATTFPAPTVGTNGTVYTASASINGGEGQAIVIPGFAAQTYSSLLSELEADAGTGAVWSIFGGNVRCTSDTTGAASSVAITAGTLFPALSTYIAVLAAVPGTDNVFGTVGTGAAPVLTFPITGAQTLTATATDAFAATGFDTAAVTVDPPV